MGNQGSPPLARLNIERLELEKPRIKEGVWGNLGSPSRFPQLFLLYHMLIFYQHFLFF